MLLLIDGHYYVYRSFHAIRNLSNSRGEPTNAIYGFIKTVRKMIKDLKPQFAAVFWDEGLPERRLKLQPAYKQQRESMPELMIPQLDFLRGFCGAMGIQSIAKPNTEADDLMGCYVRAAELQELEVFLATNDKDLFQLVTPKVRVYSTNKADLKHPKDSYALLGVTEVDTKWGVSPPGIGEILALTGDTADNIPGIEGVGPKTAVSLIQKFSTIENLLEHLDQVNPEKLRLKLETNRTRILENREMVRLELDHPLPIPIDQLTINPDYDAYIRGLEQCEFKTLLAEVQKEAGQQNLIQQTELF
jgi:5'-3' exonuclease